MSGFPTLLHKELLRFWKVAFQTILAPIVTAMLYLLIFSHVLEERVQVYPGISYTTFLVPGLIMMSMLQNALHQRGRESNQMDTTVGWRLGFTRVICAHEKAVRGAPETVDSAIA